MAPERTARRAAVLMRLFAVCALLVAVATCSQGPKRTYLVVFDTSGSMQRDRLIETVKTGFERLLDRAVAPGDSVHVYAFDEDLRSLGSQTLEGDAERQKLLQLVRSLEVRKMNTDLWGLINELQAESQRLTVPDREQVIVILSDGEDAPGPRSRRDRRINLGQFRRPDPGPVQERYIYYVSLRNQENTQVIKGLRKQIGGTVTGVKGAAADPDGKGADAAGTAGMDVVARDIQKRDWLGYLGIIWPYAVGLLVLVLIVLLVLWLIRRHRQANQPEGYLLYYEEGINAPIKSSYRLDRVQTNKVKIGTKAGSDLRVRDLGRSEVFTFACKRTKDACQLKPTGDSAGLIRPLQQQSEGLYQFGDRFAIGKYIFEFSESQE